MFYNRGTKETTINQDQTKSIDNIKHTDQETLSAKYEQTATILDREISQCHENKNACDRDGGQL